MADENDSETAAGIGANTVAGSAVVVTGGTTGIGRATARLLASRGARPANRNSPPFSLR